RVESEKGVGSRFIFDIVFDWGEELSSEYESAIPSSLRALLVDDDTDFLQYLKGILESYDVTVDAVSNGEAAVRKAKKRADYDLVFVDWQLSGINGCKTSEKLKKLLPRETKYIMVSAFDKTDIESGSKNFKADLFLQKPVLPRALYNGILNILSHGKKREEQDDASNDFRGRTILVAEDIEINREIVSSIFEETGAVLILAENGEEAVARFSENPEIIDLVLMDMQMPVMDGLTATRTIRALNVPKAKKVPILAMTANAFKEDMELCLSAGMNGHIAKPIEVDVLFEAVAKYIKKQK
ncbi:MAG: response regulator, partial [Christensenellaceae bacterium]|nr:response regulator [Christensenellaceae bacterium]